MKDPVKDERFARIATDPRFRTVPKAQQKVKIDKRFKSMFTDDRFKLKYTVDKRGRPIHTTTNESLRKYYDLTESEDDDEESKTVSSSESDASLPGGKLHLDLARGEGNVESSSSDDSSSESEFDAVEVEHPWGEFDINAPETQEITKRLAVCNVDWDRIKAQDLFILFNSFKPSGGVIHKVSIYPSEFGLQRMKEEQLWGPPELREVDESETDVKNKTTKNTSEDEEAEDASEAEESGDTAEDEEAKNTSDEEILSNSSGEEIKDNSEGEENTEDEEKQDNSEEEEAVVNSHDEEAQDNSDDEDTHNNSEEEETQVDSQDEELHDNSEDEEIQNNSEDEETQDNSEEEITQNTSDSGEPNESEDENDYIATSDEEGEENPEEALKTEKLRQYQLNRLKYYYGVVECDSPNTANAIYTECDGKEFEGSGVKMDLRFVPDDMEFDQIPKSEVTDLADPTAYKPANFISTALQQSKVNCTWDETDQDRLAVTMRKFNEEEVKENDLRAYLASSSDDEETWPVASIFDKENNTQDDDDDDAKPENGDIEEKDEDILNKYKSLLKNIEEGENKKSEKSMELEVSWEPGLKDVTKDLVKKKEENKTFTPWEQFLQKKKEKKKQKFDKKQQKSENVEEAMSDDELPADVDLNDSYFKDSFGPEFEKPKAKSKKKKKLKMVEKEETEEDQKTKAELELLVMEDDGRQHFNLEELITVDKKKNKKNRKRKLIEEKEKKIMQDNFKVNVCDPRFEALYTSHKYHIDPSNPQFKKTKGMGDIIEEKLRRVTSQNVHNVDSGKQTKPTETTIQDSKKLKDLQLSLLVKSVKSAAQSFQKRKKK